MGLVLFGAGTTRTMRAHWALHELGLEYEPRLVASRTWLKPGINRTSSNVRPSPKNFEELLLRRGVFLVAMCKDRAGNKYSPNEITAGSGVWCLLD